MIKKIILSLIIGVSFICCAILFAQRDFNDKTVIQFSTWGSESELNILKPILTKFEEENPDIKVDLLHIPQNYYQKIHLLFASNTAPDVIFMNNQYLPVYANAGVLEDLTHKDFEYDNFYSQALEALSWNGKIYGIPRDVSNLVIFYNKELFNKYKIPYPKTGWDIDEFLAAAKRLTHLPDVYGISFEEAPLFYLPYLNLYNGWSKQDVENYFTQDVLSDTRNKKGLEFYANLRKKYHVAPKKEESASATMAQMFLQGKLGMHLSGRWLVPKYRQDAKFDWDIIEFPKADSAVESTVPLDSSGWVISKSSKHKKQAIQLVKYLSSDKSSAEFTKSGLIVPARKDIANSKYFLDNQKPKNSKIFLSVIETSKPTPASIRYREILDSLKNKTEHIFN